jgi:hypothetical protein
MIKVDVVFSPDLEITTHSLQDALVALNSLQSNASVIQSWIQVCKLDFLSRSERVKARRQDLQVDINKEMLHSIKSLNLDVMHSNYMKLTTSRYLNFQQFT